MISDTSQASQRIPVLLSLIFGLGLVVSADAVELAVVENDVPVPERQRIP